MTGWRRHCRCAWRRAVFPLYKTREGSRQKKINVRYVRILFLVCSSFTHSQWPQPYTMDLPIPLPLVWLTRRPWMPFTMPLWSWIAMTHHNDASRSRIPPVFKRVFRDSTSSWCAMVMRHLIATWRGIMMISSWLGTECVSRFVLIFVSLLTSPRCPAQFFRQFLKLLRRKRDAGGINEYETSYKWNLTPVMLKTVNRMCDHGSCRPDGFCNWYVKLQLYRKLGFCNFVADPRPFLQLIAMQFIRYYTVIR